MRTSLISGVIFGRTPGRLRMISLNSSSRPRSFSKGLRFLGVLFRHLRTLLRPFTNVFCSRWVSRPLPSAHFRRWRLFSIFHRTTRSPREDRASLFLAPFMDRRSSYLFALFPPFLFYLKEASVSTIVYPFWRYVFGSLPAWPLARLGAAIPSNFTLSTIIIRVRNTGLHPQRKLRAAWPAKVFGAQFTRTWVEPEALAKNVEHLPDLIRIDPLAAHARAKIADV
jgi:hypothetical protein